MYIANVPYIQADENTGYSIVASVVMILSHYNYKITAEEFNDLFTQVFLSEEFQDYTVKSLDIQKNDYSQMMECASFCINKYVEGFRSTIMLTDIKSIKFSYIKRRIPIIVTGLFPIIGGKVPNSIVLKGYTDDQIIVNDPRGNTNSKYRDKYGENQLYQEDNLHHWISQDNIIYLLKISRFNFNRL